MHYVVGHLLTFGALIGLSKILTGFSGAAIAYRYDREIAGPRTAGGFLRYCFPKHVWTDRNVRIDACFTVITRFTSLWFVVPVVLTVLAVVPAINGALTHLFGAMPPHQSTLALQIGLVIVCILARDFMEFASHALSHRWQVLWEFHRVHHSSEFLSPFGEKRSHFIDDLWRNVTIAAIVGLSVAVYTYIFGLPPEQETLFGVPAYIVAYTIANVINFEVLHHSHIPLSFGRFERFLISPAQHHLHHDRQGPSRNFGSFLAMWDRMFGSFAHSVPPSSFKLGLPHEEQRLYMNIPEMMVRPFFGAAASIRSGVRAWRQPATPGGMAASQGTSPRADALPDPHPLASADGLAIS